MIEWFFSSAVVVAAVLGIRWITKTGISHRLRYSMWLLVLARFLIPMNFAESSLSLGRFLPTDEVMAAETECTVQIWYAATTGSLKTVESVNVWTILWLAGVVVVLGFFTVSRLHMEIRLRRDRVRLEGGCCPVPVYMTEILDAPCQVGLFRPVVYVTERAAAEEMLHHVLLHEMTHLRHFDHLWAVLRCVALALHWFDPLAWVAVWLSKEDGELACDEGVLSYLGRGEETAYGSTLIQLSCKGRGGILMGMNTLLNGKAALRRRIKAIANRKQTHRLAAVLMVVLCVMTAGCTFTDAPETTLPKPSVQVQTEATDPVQEVAGPQPGYDVWEKVTEHILTAREEEMLNTIPDFDSEEDWAEDFKRNVKNNLYVWRARYGAENAGIVSVEEIFDERAKPGVRIYEIRCYLGNPRQERSDYLILAENGKAWSSDLDSCFISDIFGTDA